jgi:spore coat protein H
MVQESGQGAAMRHVLERGSIFGFLAVALALMAISMASGASPANKANDPTITVYANAMPNQGWIPLTVYFSAFGSSDPVDGVARYEWDLDGNGSFETDATASGGYVSYQYAKPGEYRVSLRVTDSLGDTATGSTLITARHPGSSTVDYWSLFDPTTIRRIDLLVTESNWGRMWANPGAKLEVEADAVVFGIRVDRIGLSMKGNASLDASGAKKSWKLDINAFVPHQDFAGMSMLLLHNNFGDASMLREALGYEMLRFAGANAAFTTFVEVWVDVVDDDAPPQFWGVYTMVEHPDKTYLANRFGKGNDNGNLYKADAWFVEGAADLAYYGPDIADYPMPRGRLAYRKMPDETQIDHRDIIELTRVIDGVDYDTPEDFATALEQVLDVDSYLRYLAATFLHLNLDSYPYTGNNYYLYHNPATGRFEWIAWDENSSWGIFGGSYDFPLFGLQQSLGPLEYAPLFEKVFEVDRFRTKYAAYVDLLVRHWFNEEALTALAGSYHDLIAPHLIIGDGDKAYYGTSATYNPESFDSEFDHLITLTRERSRFIAGVLAESQPGETP